MSNLIDLLKKFGTEVDGVALFKQMASSLAYEPDEAMMQDFTTKLDFIRKTGETVAKAMPTPDLPKEEPLYTEETDFTNGDVFPGEDVSDLV